MNLSARLREQQTKIIMYVQWLYYPNTTFIDRCASLLRLLINAWWTGIQKLRFQKLSLFLGCLQISSCFLGSFADSESNQPWHVLESHVTAWHLVGESLSTNKLSGSLQNTFDFFGDPSIRHAAHINEPRHAQTPMLSTNEPYGANITLSSWKWIRHVPLPRPKSPS